jgi:anti-sigma B factor antagonist
MKYPVTTQAHYTIVSLSGDVDLQYSPQARELILKHLRLNQHVLVDLANVDYIDSSGVASLVEGYQLAKGKGLEFGLVGVSDMTLQVLRLARLDRVFPIHHSVTERLAEL